MLKKKYDAVIAGAGPAGLLAANVLADSGASVLLLEADRKHMGGNGVYHSACLLNMTDVAQVRASLQPYRYCHTPDRQQASGRMVAAAEMQQWSLEKFDAFAEAVPAVLRQLKKWGVVLRAAVPATQTGNSEASDIATCSVAPVDIRILPERYRRKLKQLSNYALFNRVHIPQSTVHGVSQGKAHGMWSVTAELLRYFFDYPWRLRSMQDRRACDGAALVGQLIVRLLDRENVGFAQYAQLSNIHFSHRHVMAVDFVRGQELMSVETGRLILATGDHLQDMDYAQSVFGGRFAALQSRWHTQHAGAGLADGVELAELAGAQCVRMHEVYGRLVHAPMRQGGAVPAATAIDYALEQPDCMLMERGGNRAQAGNAALRLKVYERAFHALHTQCEKEPSSEYETSPFATVEAALAADAAATETQPSVPELSPVQLDLLGSEMGGLGDTEATVGPKPEQNPKHSEVEGSRSDGDSRRDLAPEEVDTLEQDTLIAPLFAVFDSRFREKKPFGALLPATLLPDDMLPAEYWQNLLYKADTPAELAACIGVEPIDLERALAAHNRLAKAAQASDAEGAAQHTIIGAAPFYAAPVFPGHAGCRGGVKTNANGEVLTAKGYKINGLYAVGGCAASVLDTCEQDTLKTPALSTAQNDVLEFTETLVTAYRAALHAADLPLP